MGINGHTRLDLYSSCTAVQVTLKILHSYYRLFPLTKTQISVNILPRTVQLCRLDQKTPFKMGINGHTRLDLYSSCTAVQVTLKILHSYYSYFPLTKTQISVNILPRTVQLCRLDQKTPFKMGINGHTRLDLYSSCTAGQVTLKILHSYYSYFPYKNSNFS